MKKRNMHQPGIEPGSVPWQGTILPLDHWCRGWFADHLVIISILIAMCPAGHLSLLLIALINQDNDICDEELLVIAIRGASL